MGRNQPLADLQLAIVQVLWDRGEASVADVHAALLPERGLALTTIATMLRRMADKGIVRHRENGRQFLYRAVVKPDNVHRSMVGDLVDKLFDGDPLQLVHHLVQHGEIALDELEELRQRIADAEKERGRRRPGGGA